MQCITMLKKCAAMFHWQADSVVYVIKGGTQDRLSQVAAVPRNADILIKCASEVRKLKFRDK